MVDAGEVFGEWLRALEQRHMRGLRFQDVRRAVQALSSLYVERRDRLECGDALSGAGKRAAFALYFTPLRFLLVREIVRALGAAPVSSILDLGCGAGPAGAAWALESAAAGIRPRIRGVDLHPWAAAEARWTYRTCGFEGSSGSVPMESVKIPPATAVVASFAVNELSAEARGRACRILLDASRRGAPVLVVEPIARKLMPWWPEWAALWLAAGGREDAWRFRVQLPESLALMDKAAGLDHRELTGRSLWIPGRVPAPREGEMESPI
jgi:hypothetical protein